MEDLGNINRASGYGGVSLGDTNLGIYSVDKQGENEIPTGSIKKHTMGMMDVFGSSTILETSFPENVTSFEKFSQL